MPCSSLCLSQIWLLGNTEHRSKLANSCSPGSGRQGLEENHHVAYIFYASEKQIQSFLLFFSWDSDSHVHFLGALQDASAVGEPQLSPHSASLTFCLRLWSPWIWLQTICLQFLFSQVHSARCCQTNHPKTCFFLQVTSLVREIAAILCLLWDEVQIWHQIPSQTSTSVFLKFFSVLNIPLQ